MRTWFFSLQFRLVMAFASVLALTVVGVSIYVGYSVQQGAEQFRQDSDEARAARMEQLLTQFYSENNEWGGVQAVIERAGALYGWRVVLNDPQGRMLADSHRRFGDPSLAGRGGSRVFPVRVDGHQVGSLVVVPSNRSIVVVPHEPMDMPMMAAEEGFLVPQEPSVSRIVATLNRSLLWTGLAAGASGILLISLVSRRVLAPVRTLSSAARQLGRGDLSQRVAASGKDDVAQLGRTFNTMAEELEKAEQQRRSLMADVAHELRTPLSNIQGYLEAVKDGLLTPDAPTIDTIHQQVLYLNRLVEDLRLVALAETGALHVEMEPGPLDELLRHSVEAVRPRAETKGVALLLQTPSNLPPVQMDWTRTSQVVANLLENAIRHTPEGGLITVEAVVEGSRASVSVADTGDGIEPEELTHVFERFYRVDPSRTRATGGAGLGLTIARQLVEAQGGTIHVESTPGQGTRFTFHLSVAGRGSSPAG